MRDVLPAYYLHDNDEGQFGSQYVPELHGVMILFLVAWRVAVVSVPAQEEGQKKQCEGVIEYIVTVR